LSPANRTPLSKSHQNSNVNLTPNLIQPFD
jgi:hypothetical protein